MINNNPQFSDSLHKFYYSIGGTFKNKFKVDIKYLQFMFAENREITFINRLNYDIQSIKKYFSTFTKQSFKEFNFKCIK